MRSPRGVFSAVLVLLALVLFAPALCGCGHGLGPVGGGETGNGGPLAGTETGNG